MEYKFLLRGAASKPGHFWRGICKQTNAEPATSGSGSASAVSLLHYGLSLATLYSTKSSEGKSFDLSFLTSFFGCSFCLCKSGCFFESSLFLLLVVKNVLLFLLQSTLDQSDQRHTKTMKGPNFRWVWNDREVMVSQGSTTADDFWACLLHSPIILFLIKKTHPTWQHNTLMAPETAIQLYGPI